jgi:radical SAM protein with 4Fe4S-binding SPASM domain
MIRQIKEIDSSFFVKTVSNGMALTRKCSEEIIKSGLDEIEVSLDGESSNESEYVREKSNTERILKNIKRLIELKRTTGASKPAINIATVQFLRNAASLAPSGEPPVPAWLEDIFGEERAVGFKTCYALEWPHMGNSGKYDLLALGGQDGNACDHVINRMTIRADGSVVPCCHDMTSKLVMGNICQQSLADIWNGQGYQGLRQSIETKRYTSICANCPEVRPAKYLVPKFEVPR